MKYFQIEYMARGKKGKKQMKAHSKKDAIARAKGSVPGVVLKVVEIDVPFDQKLKDLGENLKNSIFKKKIRQEALIGAIRQLAVMTNAGISIHDSIREVGNAASDEILKEVLQSINDDLNSGLSLTEAARKFTEDLGELTISMMEMGESTGNMAESLNKLADILEDVLDNRKKIKKALAYPRNVSIAIAIAFTILMSYVVPKFKEIFEKLHAELPLPTKILLFFEKMINEYGLYVLGGILAIIFTLKFMLKTKVEFRKWWDKQMLKVYLIGKLTHYGSMSRFTLIFSELTRAGIPITDALDTATMTIENLELRDKLSKVKLTVQKGQNLTEAFKETKLFESMLIQMIKAGEEGGSLSEMIEKVADYYKAQFQEIIDNMSSYIEPILLAVIAGIVILIALGIFLPMWDMGKAVKH